MDSELMTFKNQNKIFIKKIFSLFSVVRGYNIMSLIIAQYLASVFIFSPQKSLRIVFLDLHLFFTVLASVFVVASGYIINNFYDADKDKINKPVKSKIDDFVSQRTKLNIYFLFNFIGVGLAYLVSWKAAFFFSVYIFLIWFYSHKLKRYPVIGLVSAVVLTILPFFVVFVYFGNFSGITFVHAIFLFLLLLIRELVKSLEYIDGDILVDNKTVPIKYGEKVTKQLCTFLALIILIPIYFLWQYPEIGLMKYYFYFTVISLIIFVITLWNSKSNRSYRMLHNLLKLLFFAGIFSLMLIDKDVILGRIL